MIGYGSLRKKLIPPRDGCRRVARTFETERPWDTNLKKGGTLKLIGNDSGLAFLVFDLLWGLESSGAVQLVFSPRLNRDGQKKIHWVLLLNGKEEGKTRRRHGYHVTIMY